MYFITAKTCIKPRIDIHVHVFHISFHFVQTCTDTSKASVDTCMCVSAFLSVFRQGIKLVYIIYTNG